MNQPCSKASNPLARNSLQSNSVRHDAFTAKRRISEIDATSQIPHVRIACPRVDAPDRPLQVCLPAHQLRRKSGALPRHLRQPARPDAHAVFWRLPVHTPHIHPCAVPQPGAKIGLGDEIHRQRAVRRRPARRQPA